jgi:hypothetical protein
VLADIHGHLPDTAGAVVLLLPAQNQVSRG